MDEQRMLSMSALHPSSALARRVVWVCVTVTAGLYAVAAASGARSVDDWDSWTDFVLLVLVLVGLRMAIGRARVEADRRWWLPALGFAGLAFSQLMLTLGTATWLSGSYLTLADGGVLLWHGSYLTFLFLHLRHLARWGRLVHLVEAAMLAAAVLFIVWETLILPQIDDPSSLGLATEVLVVLYPALNLIEASIIALLLMVDRSPARLLLFATFFLNGVGDVAASMSADYPTAGTLSVAGPAWVLGCVTAALAVVSPGGARLDPARPSVWRLAVVSVPLAAAVWLATIKYVIGDTPTTMVTIVLGVVAGGLWTTGRVADFLQATSWADRLRANIGELEQTQAELRELLDDLPEAVVVVDRAGRIREANAHVRELTGHYPEDVLGKYFTELFPADQRAELLDLWRQMRGGDPMTNPTFRLVRADGTEALLEGDANLPIRNPDRVVVALRDVTARVMQAKALESARERFRLVFDKAPIGMAVSRLSDAIVLDVNDRMAEMLGYSADEIIGRSATDFILPTDNDRSLPVRERARLGLIDEKRYIRKDGGLVWTRVWVSMLTDTDGESLVVGHVEDITEQRHSAERMAWAATHDGLTGLPNRFRFLEVLGDLLSAAPLGSIAVLFIDLDNFKVINDSLGHEAGDQLLRAMSERLRAVVRDRDMLGRFGGDEFIVLLRDVSGAHDPFDIAERLRAEIALPVEVEGADLYVTASIGITINDRDGITTTEMLRDADAAMYRAKAHGRDCVEVYSPGSHDATVLTLRTSNELRRGLERGEIVPYYQPIVNLESGQLLGFEVLARWRHPDRGLLGPDQFLPMAEETGLISDVGSSVLRASLAQLGQWRNSTQRFADLSLSVNVSVRQLMSSHLVDVVSEALAESGVSAGALWLEITETALMSDVKAATVALRELRSLGLHLAVDDFGTGYSSLTYLKRFPVEAIKVDRSFVNGLGIDSEDSTIVEAVVKLGHSLNLQVVAEGVETPLQLARLREIGCDRAQGYLFGRPRPAELIETEYSLH